jgi:hypothetical protein
VAPYGSQWASTAAQPCTTKEKEKRNRARCADGFD